MQMIPNFEWPYLPIIVRLSLALALGLFVGLERERRGKEAGLRTFGFVALIGALGGLLGESFSLLAIILVGLLVVFLNIQTLLAGQGTELTTSAALLVTGIAGVLCGQGHTLTPAAVAVLTAALLAWKQSLSNFTLGLSETELRSAILMAILAFVIYPALPQGSVDSWGAIDPREAWITVILIAGIGFVNYILWKLYGTRGIELAGFLSGLVNSSVTVSELAARVRETKGQLNDVAYRSIVLATAAMLLRNAALLAILAPRVLLASLLPLVFMLAACALFALGNRKPLRTVPDSHVPLLKLESPFSLLSAFKFGLLFLAIQIAGVVAQRTVGQYGVYVVSLFGGMFSSSSAVAAVAAIFAKATISGRVAGLCAVIASLASVLVDLPLVTRAHEPRLTQSLLRVTAVVTVCGLIGAFLQDSVLPGLIQH